MKTIVLRSQSSKADGRNVSKNFSDIKLPKKGRAYVASVSCRDTFSHKASGDTSGIQLSEASRRSILLAAPLFGVAATQQPPLALADDFGTFYGEANPFAKPYSMLQPLGGCVRDSARYSFLYPSSWTEEAVGKIEKETNGTDCTFNSPPRFKEKLYVNSLAISGISDTEFSLDKMDAVLARFTRIDTDIRDAVDEGSVVGKTITERNGSKWYDFEISGPSNYLMAITSRDSRAYAIFITAPPRAYNKDKEMLTMVRDSFTTYIL